MSTPCMRTVTWLQRYQLRRTVRQSLWLPPAVAIVSVMALAPLVRWLDRAMGWTWFGVTPEGARSVLGAFTASMLTFIVFVVSSLLIVVQLASTQLTPRVIALVFSLRRVRWVLAAFTFAFTYTVATAGRIDAVTPQLPVALAVALNLVCIILFFWFAQEVASALRPISVLVEVANEGLAVVERTYSKPFDPVERTSSPTLEVSGFDVIDHAGLAGVVQAFGCEDLLALTEKAGASVELIPQVGDFLSKGEPLFRVYPGGRPVNAAALRGCVAIGPERTLDQDPRFAFRIIVDVANKALSPAINDPTTAVLAVDQLHRLLRHVGNRRLDKGQVRDARGCTRFRYRTPEWADFVSLAASEIRHYGAGSLQVARRLRAMLEHLLRVLPEARRPALRQELNLLQCATRRLFPDDEDQNSATVGDMQGIGGSHAS